MGGSGEVGVSFPYPCSDSILVWFRSRLIHVDEQPVDVAESEIDFGKAAAVCSIVCVCHFHEMNGDVGMAGWK